MINKGLLVLIILLIISGVLFYKFGRSFWVPVYLKVNGRITVAEAIQKIEKRVLDKLTPVFDEKNVGFPFEKIALLGFKHERILELWIKSNNKWVYLKSYPFTAFSGTLGPKLKEGDKQIPEGIYCAESLNPNSSYYLSIKLNYPNKYDRKMGAKDERKNLGNNIFIHGKSITIGCIPIGDKAIEEIFYLTRKTGIQNVKIIISPYNFNSKRLQIQNKKIDWETDLYDRIKVALMTFNIKDKTKR